MQHEPHHSHVSSRPIAIEVDGEPLGIVLPSPEGYRFLAVRFHAFAMDGQTFDSVEAARAAAGAIFHRDSDD